MQRNLKIIGIIPARLGSSRFPGKPLAKILGIPMVGHVYFRSRFCRLLDDVYVATPDREVASYINSIQGKVVMTSKRHKRAADRIAEAMLAIEKENQAKIDLAVLIQGDEPLLYPQMISQALGPLLKDKTAKITNLMSAISKEECKDPNVVKVVVDKFNYALYFSRSPIPYGKKAQIHMTLRKQVAIIPFRRDFLLKFARMKPTLLEEIESVDMLRLVERAWKVKMVSTRYKTKSVDTRKDLGQVEKMMRRDRLFRRYARFIN